MLAWLSNPDAQLILISPTILEIVLGAGNIFFISILSGKLPAEQRGKARNTGLALALTGQRLVLLFGGLFLI